MHLSLMVLTRKFSCKCFPCTGHKPSQPNSKTQVWCCLYCVKDVIVMISGSGAGSGSVLVVLVVVLMEAMTLLCTIFQPPSPTPLNLTQPLSNLHPTPLKPPPNPSQTSTQPLSNLHPTPLNLPTSPTQASQWTT